MQLQWCTFLLSRARLFFHRVVRRGAVEADAIPKIRIRQRRETRFQRSYADNVDRDAAMRYARRLIFMGKESIARGNRSRMDGERDRGEARRVFGICRMATVACLLLFEHKGLFVSFLRSICHLFFPFSVTVRETLANSLRVCRR